MGFRSQADALELLRLERAGHRAGAPGATGAGAAVLEPRRGGGGGGWVGGGGVGFLDGAPICWKEHGFFLFFFPGA